MIIKSGPFVLLLLCGASSALAHSLPGEAHGFSSGLSHPLSGLDHLVAMIAIGLWAAQCGGRFPLILTATFAVAAVGGWLLFFAGVTLPGIEAGILVSMLIGGVLVAFAARPPAFASIALLAVFALFHGQAHASMPFSSAGMAYQASFLVMTVLLLAVGTGLGLYLQRSGRAFLVRGAGGVIALNSLLLAFG